MPKYLFLFLLSIPFHVSAQTFNYATHDAVEKTFNITGINSKSFYLIKSTTIPSCCSDYIALVGNNSDGTEFFRTVITTDPYTNYAGVAVTSNKRLLVYGGTNMKGCDYGGPRFMVYEVDTLGNINWGFATNKLIANLLPRPNGNFYMLATDSLYHYNSSGQLITKYVLSLGLTTPMRCGTLLNNGTILISYGYPPRLRIVDSTGVIVNDVSTGFFLNAASQAPNGNIYASSGKYLQKFSSSLMLLSTTATVLPASYSVAAFYFKNDLVFAAGQDSLFRPAYLLFDTALNILHQSPSNLEGFRCTGIYPDKQNVVKLIAWGSNDLFNYSSHTFSGYFHTTILGNLNGRKDVGVTKVLLVRDSIYSFTMYGSPIKLFRGFVEVNATVKNFGSDTVTSFKLNYYSSIGGLTFCLIGLNKQYNLLIAPGDSVTVNTGTFNIQQFNESSLNPDGTVNLNICINSTVPDSENDINITNDAACGVVLNHPLGLREEPNIFSNLKLFPNPTKSSLTITNDKLINQIQIFDICGRLLVTYFPNDLSFELQNTELQDGLYLVKVFSEQGIATRKILFSRE